MATTPHALLLSGSLGMGHDVMAEACAVSLARRGWTSETMNSLTLMGKAAGGWGERVFRTMLGAPGVYDAFHFEQLRAGGRLARLAERSSSHYAGPVLAAALERQPAQLIVSVFATGAAAAARVKADRRELVTVTFCTDVNPHSMWVHPGTDLYLVTSRTAAGFVRRFHPDAEIQVVPTPVRPPFYTAPIKSAARDALGIPHDQPCAVLMAGAWALGPLVESAIALAEAGIHTLAVAGRNTEIENRLWAAACQLPSLHPFGYTDQVPLLMAAADVVITTSGDTCSEARVIGRHLLLLDLVPGHGRENLQHELERGEADVVPTDPTGLVCGVTAALQRIADRPDPPAGTAAAWEQAFGAALAQLGLDAAVTGPAE